MKRTFLLIALIGFSFAGFSQTDSSKIKDIKRLLVLSGSASNAKAGVEGMVASMKGSPNLNGLPEGFWDEFLKEINYDELLTLYIPIYEKYYSHEEITAMIHFYESTAGKKLVETMPKVLAESMEMGRTWGQQIGMKVMEKMKKK